MNRAERLARLLRVLAAVIAEPGLNPLELADRAGVSERTLRRDLAELRDLGYDVAYTKGYEVQEKLNLDGKGRHRTRERGDDALLQAVAQAVSKAGLWQAAGVASPVKARRRAPRATGKLPLVLIPSGENDAEFVYATGMPLETGLYVRFAAGDDMLVASPLEIDRVRVQSKAARKLSLEEAGFEDAGRYDSWARLAAKLLRDRGHGECRVSPHLAAAYFEALKGAGLDVEIDRELFLAERRRKTPDEAKLIAEAQRAAEAALLEIVRLLSQAEIRGGLLWTDGKPLTSEWLYARASLILGDLGFACPDMIIAGSPECAMPHYRGEGQIRAGAPVIIDIFPTGRVSHYHGDLTRTVVVGEVPDQVRRMHAAAVQALDAAIESIRGGVLTEDVHKTVCQVLVDRDFGTTTPAYEGPDGVPKMNHGTGHGVGLDIHEAPSVRAPNSETLQPGDVITVEPGLYLMGLGGVRVEDTGTVTENGFQNFTTITRSLEPRDYL